MKNTLLFMVFFYLFTIGAQEKITPLEWQKDLRFLQQTVHDDYPFLFKKTRATEFDAAIDKFYAALPQMQDHEIVVGFAKIIALFKYGHTRMSFSETGIPYHRLPLEVYLFPDGLYITGAHNDYASLVGSKITAIEGKSTEEVLEAIYPVAPVENEQFFKAYGLGYVLIPEVLHAQGVTTSLKQGIDLSLEKGGEAMNTMVTASKGGEELPLQYGEVKPGSDWVSVRDVSNSPLYLKDLDKIYYFEYLPDQKAVYVRHSQIQDEPSERIPAFYERLFEFIENKEVEKLILDVRLNGGGNNYKNKPIVTGIIEHPEINRPGKLFVIIGRRTFSACQNLVNELDNYTEAIFVGEPTGENINFYGDNRRVVLPNSKLPVYLSFAWWQDKPQWENADYTSPHLPVVPTFAEYSGNKDPALDAILNLKGEVFIRDPMGYLTQLFMEEKFDLLATEAQRMVNDPMYRFFNFETEFGKVGYRLLGNDNEAALYVFQLTAQLFPESANAWLGLGQAYQEIGNIDKAKESFQKTVELDPEGPLASSAIALLQRLTEED
ncbi:tetratricopeptide repeat protein [Flavobacteriaceae bacterium TP-CH-4]|uniref:Tetratricopeptide repeat protein n=1 Tax=Pelagihabitans pacificus TaxID=2696054 RepID=A0A967ATD6_9FLAO|nr:tetratricopeptide repeat protein [Pelagihabitans pacificus]NHF59948.1 tetratricopeptide repeat protein [Pelagihabitans pacificus]